ncbi:RNA 2'-phosphotransferase [Pseudooceanicola batsensis]|nr:RNA 2'-phosphotransferase [Pseudooceanicola batsensis]
MSREGRFLSRVLRHEPELLGLTLKPGGWVEVDLLLRALRRAGRGMSRGHLVRLVADDNKRRFTLSEGGERIRAAQGHSLAVDLTLAPQSPPAVLYHGTNRQSLDSIFQSGLLSGRRQFVHLSADVDTALDVGTRHGKPIVLSVEAGAMSRGGHQFWVADNGVWLTRQVPAQFLAFAPRHDP